ESAQTRPRSASLHFAFLLHTIDSSLGQGALWPEGIRSRAGGTDGRELCCPRLEPAAMWCFMRAAARVSAQPADRDARGAQAGARCVRRCRRPTEREEA